MDLIRKYLLQIKAQLTGLTISQKLLIGLLSVVMIATIFFTVVYSAKPAMVPLIPQAMSADQIARVEMEIKKKYDYQISADRILVPAEQAYAIRGELAAAGALPKNMVTAFHNMIDSANPFSTERMNDRAWNNALQEELSRILSNFPYLEESSVIIAHGQPAGIGKPAEPSTAMVSLKTRGGATLTSTQVNAVGELVLGAVSGIKREDVHIIDEQRAYHMQSMDDIIPENLRELKKAMEDDLGQKLLTMFDHFGNVKIAVNVDPDFSVRERDVTAYDPKTTVVKELSTTQRELISTQGSGAAEGQPGVTPNVGMAVDTGNGSGAAGRKQSSSSTDTTANNVVQIGGTREHIKLPAGIEIKQMTASLSLPRSYFVRIYQRGQKVPKDPEDNDPAFAAIVTEQMKKAQPIAMNAIGAKSPDQIRVDWYDDTILSRPAEIALASAAGAGLGGSVMGMVSQYARQGVLAVVALGALGMMLMMVRRAVPAADGMDIDTGSFFGGGGKSKRRGKGKNEEVDQLNAGDDVFGEANEGNAVLTGIELDDETLQSRKMVDEVSTMIKENPENAAALVKRWMAKSK